MEGFFSVTALGSEEGLSVLSVLSVLSGLPGKEGRGCVGFGVGRGVGRGRASEMVFLVFVDRGALLAGALLLWKRMICCTASYCQGSPCLDSNNLDWSPRLLARPTFKLLFTTCRFWRGQDERTQRRPKCNNLPER